jgi:hypothetical protein
VRSGGSQNNPGGSASEIPSALASHLPWAEDLDLGFDTHDDDLARIAARVGAGLHLDLLARVARGEYLDANVGDQFERCLVLACAGIQAAKAARWFNGALL